MYWLAFVVASLSELLKVFTPGLVSTWMGDCHHTDKSSQPPSPRSTQPGHPSVGRCKKHQWKLGCK